MDQLRKMLARLTKRERDAVLDALRLLDAGNIEQLDIISLKGKKGKYRVRIGSLRLLVVKEGKSFRARYLFRRNEKTYRNL